MKFSEITNEESTAGTNEKGEFKPFEVDYAQGTSSKRKRKVFKKQGEFEKWYQKSFGDIEIYSFSELDD